MVAGFSDGRIRVTYELTLGDTEAAEAKAREIALEQTVELPAGCYPDAIEQRIVGRVEALDMHAPARCTAVVSYDPVFVGSEVPQLLNLLFGNISLKRGIVVRDVEFPNGLLDRFPGPQFGIEGVRSACAVTDRPLLCTAAKPVGLSPVELAGLCGALARGGIDIVKDDHSVTDQEPARFRERVERCVEAVCEANRQTEGRTLYFPNVTAPLSDVEDRARIVAELGCRGALVNPFLMGLDVIRWLAESQDLILFSHPTMSGVYLHPDHGIAPAVLFGRILRMLGSDGVVFINAGGRFPVSEEDCRAICSNLTAPLGPMKAAFPVAGGGVDVDRIGGWIDRYGKDLVFLISSSLYAQTDLEQASRALVDSVKRHCDV